jgi:hypothetical protein
VKSRCSAPLISFSRIGVNSFVRVANSVMRCSSARAREELICAKRASLGTVVLDEAVDFDELGGDIACAAASLVWHDRPRGRTRYERLRGVRTSRVGPAIATVSSIVRRAGPSMVAMLG